MRAHLVDFELSIGDYVLTGGELPAMVVVEALTRLEDEFGYDLKPEALNKDPGLVDLLASAEYSGWLTSRQP